MILTGQTNNNTVRQPAKIKSVTVTNETGGGLGVSIAPYDIALGNPILRVFAGTMSTVQVSYDGISFPDGFTVIPDATLTHYVIEYELFNNG